MLAVMSEHKNPERRASPRERAWLGNRLRESRQKAGLTLEASAEALGVVRQAISKWERGDTYPTTDRLEKAAELYGVSVDWLFGQEKRIAEAPAIYYPGEAPATDEEMRLAMEFIRILRRQRHKDDGPLESSGHPKA